MPRSNVLRRNAPQATTEAQPGANGGWRTVASLLCGATLAIVRPAGAASPIDNCIDCHGTDGIAAEEDSPHLNGQPDHVLVDMINAFREGRRHPRIRIHREIRLDNVEPIAAHYAGQKVQRPRQAARPELVVRGEALHLQHCADCHMDNGRDSDKGAPLTAAQNLDYLINQARAFKSGTRPLPATTERTFRVLSEDDLIAISHFFAAQDQHAPKESRRRRR